MHAITDHEQINAKNTTITCDLSRHHPNTYQRITEIAHKHSAIAHLMCYLVALVPVMVAAYYLHGVVVALVSSVRKKLHTGKDRRRERKLVASQKWTLLANRPQHTPEG